MRSAPGSLETLRRRNRLLVLEAVQQRGTTSRVEVTRSTGLSRTTVSSLVAELVADGVLADVPTRAKTAGGPGGGRPASPITLNPERGGVLGVHLGHDGVRVVIANLAGGVLGETRREIDVERHASEALGYAADAALALTRDSGLEFNRVLGMGVAVCAPVQPASQTLRSPSMLRDWTDLDVAGRLRDRVGLPVYIGNDANLGAMAEWSFGVGRGSDDLIYVMLSAGVGAGLILNGQPYVGATGIAGELGHVAVTADGYLCRCGNRGCLETVAGTRALVGAVSHSRGPGTTLADVFALAAADDPGCVRVLGDAGRAVGRALTGICAVLDPRLIVIGGRAAAAGAPLLGGVREVLSRSLPPALSQGVVVAGELGERAEVLGAVALATRSTSADLLSP